MTSIYGDRDRCQKPLPGMRPDPPGIPPTKQKERYGQQGWWRMKDGWLVQITDMETMHLKNSIKMMIRCVTKLRGEQFDLQQHPNQRETAEQRLRDMWWVLCCDPLSVWRGTHQVKMIELVQELRLRPRGKTIRAFEDKEILDYIWLHMTGEAKRVSR